MKALAEIKALQRELDNRIKVLSTDTQFINTSTGKDKIASLEKRQTALNLIADNIELIDWLINPDTGVTRKELVNQDGV
jgi:hypothetical protein|tara:strand:- start:52 stop:288 length:237 start_codon:yes stop_codon:yes gene_type:complete